MPTRRSAGILLYRRRDDTLQVFLVHPGGPYWQHKDAGAWSIPKGEYAEDEEALEAAQRELREETGFAVTGRYLPLTPRRQPSGKLITAFALEADVDPAALRSNSFEMEWPPGSGRRQCFPEVDRGDWYDLAAARDKLIEGQRPFLDELSALLAAAGSRSG